MQDIANALVSQFTVKGADAGPLAGSTFVAKDIYDIRGHVTGCGNPDWAATHDVAAATAPAVQKLLDAGATLSGKSHTDEIAYSLMGVNAHYGTPVNSAAPDRIPGGSSSGSVAAVAAGMVDIGLGSDTGGSVRMPASFCGVYGIRTTHGMIDLSNVMPLASSFDTAGWFARDAETFAEVGVAYGMDAKADAGPVRLIVAVDAMQRTTGDGAQSFAPAIRRLEEMFGEAEIKSIAVTDLSDWLEVFKVCQAAEVWQSHGDWVTRTQPDFGPGVKERFDMAASITGAMWKDAGSKRSEIAARMADLIGEDGVMITPSSPGAAPLRSADGVSLDQFRMAALELLCPAGLAGLPQISLPVGTDDGAPLGLSLIAGKQQDWKLLSIARKLSA